MNTRCFFLLVVFFCACFGSGARASTTAKANFQNAVGNAIAQIQAWYKDSNTIAMVWQVTDNGANPITNDGNPTNSPTDGNYYYAVVVLQSSSDGVNWQSVLTRISNPPGSGPNFQTTEYDVGGISALGPHWRLRAFISRGTLNTIAADDFESMPDSNVSHTKQVRLSVFNDKDYVVNYMIVDAANQTVATFSLQPHTGIVQTVDVGDQFTLPLKLVAQVQGAVIDSNGNWVEQSGAITNIDTTVNGGTSTLTPRTSGDTGSDSVDPLKNVPTGTGDESLNGGSVWKPSQDSTTPTDLLTKPVFREGVDKITSRLDKLTQPLQDAKKFDVNQALAAAQSAAGNATQYTGPVATLSQPALNVGGGGSAPVFGQVTIAGHTLIVGMSGAVGTTESILLAMRSALLIAMVIGFARGVARDVSAYVIALPQVNAQDSATGVENVIPGVTQAKVLTMAAAAVTTILVAAAAMVAVVDTAMKFYGVGIADAFRALDVPGASNVAVIDQYVPLAPGLGLAVLGAAVPYILAPLFLGAAAVIRFLKV